MSGNLTIFVSAVFKKCPANFGFGMNLAAENIDTAAFFYLFLLMYGGLLVRSLRNSAWAPPVRA